MPRPLPLPTHEPDAEAREIIDRIYAYARDTDDDTTSEERLQRLASAMHIWIAAEASWEHVLVEAKSQANPGWLSWDRLVEKTKMRLSTMQDRIGKGPARYRATQVHHELPSPRRSREVA
jgi:hypothetical protein